MKESMRPTRCELGGNCEHSQQWQRKQNDRNHPDIGLQVMELWGFVHQNGELECATEKVFKREIKGRRVLRHVVGRIKNPGNEDGMERGCERVADGYFLSRRSIFTHFGGTGEQSSDPPQILLTSTSQNDGTFGYSLHSVVVGRPCPKAPPRIPCTRESVGFSALKSSSVKGTPLCACAIFRKTNS